ncbi:hypothetical protein ACQKPX_23470 [Photobacterium sp. DNB23_23_1]
MERYETSKITQRAACDQNGMSLSTFVAKRRQFQAVTQSAPLGLSEPRSSKRQQNIGLPRYQRPTWSESALP